jgi:uncharacterized protein (TIGR03083 family)
MAEAVFGPVDLGDLYRNTRVRLTALVSCLDVSELAAPVPTCPGWSIADVICHLAGGVEDVLAGRLTGPPTDAQTAEQVRRHRGKPTPEVVDLWNELAPAFEGLIGAGRAWPAVLDIVSHEHDIRGAIGRPGGRDSPGVYLGAEALCARARGLPVAIRLIWEDGETRMGTDTPIGLILYTTRFETLRWRLGRRSRTQMERLAWSGDPTPVLDHLALFGPARSDIIE